MRGLSVIVALLLAVGLPASAQAPDRKQPAAPQAATGAPHPALAKASRAAAGTRAPAIRFTDAKGGVQTLADFRGKPVLVNLWATWCAPCVAEMPALDRLHGRADGRLTVLAISQDIAGWRAVGGFAKPGRFKVLPIRVDSANDFALAVKAKGLPMTILYDAQGREVWRLAGPAEWDQVPVNALLR